MKMILRQTSTLSSLPSVTSSFQQFCSTVLSFSLPINPIEFIFSLLMVNSSSLFDAKLNAALSPSGISNSKEGVEWLSRIETASIASEPLLPATLVVSVFAYWRKIAPVISHSYQPVHCCHCSLCQSLCIANKSSSFFVLPCFCLGLCRLLIIHT